MTSKRLFDRLVEQYYFAFHRRSTSLNHVTKNLEPVTCQDDQLFSNGYGRIPTILIIIVQSAPPGALIGLSPVIVLLVDDK
ncbi:NADP-dependent malic enzyme isoform X1 [Vespula squamosa]|uniref:NADP-dependent malic enzyme isoform X1 n=1 Tax=Vespula squamosa TaxID=30214 RepID=A0ABD2A745_VESSQ